MKDGKKIRENKRKVSTYHDDLTEIKGRMKEHHKQIVSIIGLIVFVVFMAAVAYFIGKPMMQIFIRAGKV